MRILFKVSVVLLACSWAWSACPLKPDEEVVFFPRFGYQTVEGKTWQVPIEGWVYEAEKESKRVATSRALLRKTLGIPETEKDNPTFVRRADAFLVDNERNKSLSVTLAGKTVALKASDPAGRIQSQTTLPWHTQPGEVRFRVPACAKDPRIWEGTVTLLEPRGRMVVSDIDDTLKISEVHDRNALISRTLVQPYEAVPNMSRLFSWWKAQDASTAYAYVSASPRPLYRPLRDFLHGERFPAGALYLKPFRWKDESFFELFNSSSSYKTVLIESLLKQFPQRRFTLVGDTGERDPKIYADLARKYPTQITQIYLRVVDPKQNREQYEDTFIGLPGHRWTLFKNASELLQ